LFRYKKALEVVVLIKKSLFQCPVCSEPLYQGIKQYYCINKHQFDIARKGYVNLLLPYHTGKGEPGDSKEMIQSRKEFLDKGYYEEFSNRLNELALLETSTTEAEELNLIDVGCGEGYYPWRLKNKISSLNRWKGVNIYGLDVSKPAIRFASGRDKDIRFAVASTYHLPIISSCLDLILCIFAPRNENEFKRILKPTARLVVAAPGSQHLYSLKKELYGEANLIGPKGTVREGFRLINLANVSYCIELKETADILNLLMMTPYCRHVDSRIMERVCKLSELITEVDINIMVYQRE
jgi:23S rRNA (guanine745-N1)-methyltransferase